MSLTPEEVSKLLRLAHSMRLSVMDWVAEDTSDNIHRDADALGEFYAYVFSLEARS